MKIKIKIDTFEDALDLVSTCGMFKGNIDASAKRTDVDGKSLLGVLSLGVNKHIKIKYITDDSEDSKRFEEEISKRFTVIS